MWAVERLEGQGVLEGLRGRSRGRAEALVAGRAAGRVGILAGAGSGRFGEARPREWAAESAGNARDGAGRAARLAHVLGSSPRARMPRLVECDTFLKSKHELKN